LLHMKEKKTKTVPLDPLKAQMEYYRQAARFLNEAERAGCTTLAEGRRYAEIIQEKLAKELGSDWQPVEEPKPKKKVIRRKRR